MENNISVNLAKLRKQARYSRKDIAQTLEVNEMTVGAYERGEKTPSIDKLLKLADFFGVSLDELVRGDVEDSKGDNQKRRKLYRDFLNLPKENLEMFSKLLAAAAEINRAPNSPIFIEYKPTDAQDRKEIDL